MPTKPRLSQCAGDDQGWMQSPAVAKRFGIQTGTLNKWRQHGKGPRSWKRVSPTVVVYPVSEVLKFEEQWKGETACTEIASRCSN